MKQHIELNGKTILVTGSPGFIGANLVLRLLREMTGGTVISLDNMNDYYDPALKEYRLDLIEAAAQRSPVKHIFVKGSIADRALIDRVFAAYKPAVVVNLAAQAGVRYSIDHPDVYIESNLIGFYNILEACRHNPVEHLVYASSSSVYGGNKKVPFSTDDKVDNPVSLYAATKKSDELLAHSYSKLYNIPSTGLRFFTVYGPAGRPDMFYFSATKTLSEGGTIKIFNYGDMKRDFTYVDDIVEGVFRVTQGAPVKENGPEYNRYATCEKCGAMAARRTKEVTVRAASYSHQGEKEITYECKHCDSIYTSLLVIPMLVHTSSSSSSSSYSSGRSHSSSSHHSGGSFGGGRSGGGGHSGRW